MTDQDLPLGEISEIVEEKASDEKLQKVLARAGVGSRREMERLDCCWTSHDKQKKKPS